MGCREGAGRGGEREEISIHGLKLVAPPMTQPTFSVEELQENKVKKIEAALEEHGKAACLQISKAEIDKWKTEKVNLAIAGRTGTVKSSFINSLVDKWTGTSPAKVGVGITETTVECVGYSHPNNLNILMWDLSGVGTENFPQQSYLEKVNASLFDVFIIMTAGRFTEQDTWLGKVMQERNTPVIFVRTKIGIDVKYSKHDHPEKDGKIVLKEVKADTMAECTKFLQALGIFVIDFYKSDMYEFSYLEKRIVEKIVTLKRSSVVFLY